MKIKTKIASLLASIALLGGLGLISAAPAQAQTQYLTVNCSMFASNLNAVRVINFTAGPINIKAYAANGALISNKTSSAGTVWGYGNRTSYTRFVVTGASFAAAARCS